MDRISKLDDKLLSTIVSFLPLKEMLRTSVLSQRWRYVWTAARAFDFIGDEWSDMGVYISRIDRCLDQLSASLSCTEISNIVFPAIQDPQVADRWIHFATDHNVANLVFDLPVGIPVLLSLSRFRLCRSLTALQLYGFILDPPPAYPLGPAFPSLRTLSLYDVTIADPRSFFKHCPVIEDLDVEFPDDDREYLLPASALRSCPLLSTLTLADCTIPREPPSAAPPAFPSLRAVKLINVRVGASQLLLDSCPVIAELTVISPPEGFPFRLERCHTVSTLRIIGRDCSSLSFPSLSPSLRTLALCDLKITNPPALVRALQGLEVLLLKRVRIEPGTHSGIQVQAPRMRHLMVQDSKGLGLVTVVDAPQLCLLFCRGDISHLRVLRCAVPNMEEAFLHCMVKNPYGGKYYRWKNLMQPLSHVRLLSTNWWFVCEVWFRRFIAILLFIVGRNSLFQELLHWLPFFGLRSCCCPLRFSLPYFA